MKSALERAADLLARARFPVFGGLLTDIRGAEAALALAAKLGGVIDHAAGESLARMSQIMRERGASSASFGEARNRADIIVIVGQGNRSSVIPTSSANCFPRRKDCRVQATTCGR